MFELLFWLYMANAILLIDHEIDSAYWREWEMFGLRGGIAGFLLMHVPTSFVVLYGLVLVAERTFAGLVFSLVLCAAGVFAFCIHTYFLKKGRPEFDAPISKAILAGTLVVSIAQAVITIAIIVNGGLR